MGNLLTQVRASGELGSLTDMRAGGRQTMPALPDNDERPSATEAAADPAI